MFRKMRRFKQQITDEQCIEVLKNAKRGVLSLIGEDGYPYGLPINQWYCEEDGKIYFHGAKEGHKIDAIKALSDADQVVIACGGGGIPVLSQDNKLQGASAVIEKDLAAGKLAELLDADMLVILTSVDKVCLNFGTEDEKPLDTLTVAEARKYLEAGEFGEGTMSPKIEAAIDFIGDSAVKSVLITKLNKDATEITGGMGTLIKK